MLLPFLSVSSDTDMKKVRSLEFGTISSSRYVNILPQRGKYHYAWWTVCGLIEDVIWNSSWFPTYWEVLPNLSQMSHLYVLICYSTVLIKRNVLQLPRQSYQKWSAFTQEVHTIPPGQRKWTFIASHPRGGLATPAILARSGLNGANCIFSIYIVK